MLQPHNPVLDAYRDLSGNVVELAAPLLAKSFLVSENEQDPPYLRTAKNEWQPIPRLLQQIETALTGLGEAIVQISFDGRLSPEAKRDDLAAATAAARLQINGATAEITTRADRIVEVLRTAAFPARPGVADAAQEARISGLKADLRMVWDPVGADQELVQAITESLQRSIGDDDELQSWLIASTRWPEDYLRSRGAEHYIELLQQDIATTLDSHSPANLTQARRLYRTLSDGRYGLPVLASLFGHLDGIVDDLAAWRGAA